MKEVYKVGTIWTPQSGDPWLQVNRLETGFALNVVKDAVRTLNQFPVEDSEVISLLPAGKAIVLNNSDRWNGALAVYHRPDGAWTYIFALDPNKDVGSVLGTISLAIGWGKLREPPSNWRVLTCGLPPEAAQDRHCSLRAFIVQVEREGDANALLIRRALAVTRFLGSETGYLWYRYTADFNPLAGA